MNSLSREEKLRQIMSGFFHFKYKNNLYKYYEPMNETYAEISYYTNSLEADLKRDGFLTEQDELEILIRQGVWSDENEKNLLTFKEEIERLKKEKPNFKYKSNSLKALDNTIAMLKMKIIELEETRNSMFLNTIEYQKHYRTNILLLSQCVRNLNSSRLWSSVEDMEESLGVGEIELMLREVTNKSKFDLVTIRDLARNEPWRTMWKTSSKTGTPLFSRPVCDLTKAQYELCYWSNVYDSVYESADYPGHEVIDDDESLDDWFLEQSLKYSSSKNKNQNPTIKNKKIANAGEVFIPVESYEDAVKVYQDMNSSTGKAILNRRSDAIEKEGSLSEDNLPDVKDSIKMEVNKMGFKGK